MGAHAEVGQGVDQVGQGVDQVGQGVDQVGQGVDLAVLFSPNEAEDGGTTGYFLDFGTPTVWVLL